MFTGNIIKALSDDKRIRIIFAELTDITDKISQIHEFSGEARKLFSQAAVGTVLLGADLKTEGTNISAVLRSYTSPISAVVIYDSNHNIRGYFKADDTHNSGFDSLGGQGTLTVMCDDGRVGLYTSTVPLNGESMEASITEYLKDSQQHEGILRLYYNDERAVGVLISPVLNDELVFVNERRQELLGLIEKLFCCDNEKAVEQLLDGHGFDILSSMAAKWSCNCSRASIDNVVKSVGKAEAQSIVGEMGAIEIVCPYCKTKYRYDAEQTNALFKD